MMERIKEAILAMVTVLVDRIAPVINRAKEGIKNAVTVLVDRIAPVINRAKEGIKNAVTVLVDRIAPVMSQLAECIRTVAIAFVAVVAVAFFVSAGILYGENQYWETIVLMGLLSMFLLAVQMALLAVQTGGKNILKRRTWNLWNLRATILIIVVGLSTHYSALVIGVSFGGVYSQATSVADKCSISGGPAWWPDIIAVLIMQAVLSSAACILIDQFRQSNAVRGKAVARKGRISRGEAGLGSGSGVQGKAVAHKGSMYKCRD